LGSVFTLFPEDTSMRVTSVTLTVGALLLAAPAFAQPAGGKVTRTQIINGGTVTVRYSTAGLSPGEAQSVKDIERLENESNYLRGLNDLKREYVANERALAAQRLVTQQQLYGTNISRTGLSLPFTAPLYGRYGFGGFGGFGSGFYGGAAPLYTGYGLGGYGLGGGAPGLTTTNRSLANGVGDEGSIQSSMAAALARQSSEEYAETVARSLDRVLVRASESPNLRVALHLPAGRRPGTGDGGIRTVGDEVKSGVLLTLKSGEKVLGQKMEERGAWFLVKLKSGRTLRVRESEVLRIESGDGDVIKPAAGGETP